MSKRCFHHISFIHAFAGLRYVFWQQPNLRIHTAIAFLACLLAFLLGFGRLEWAILVFTIFWVMVSEMINTVVEAVCDLVTLEYRTEIKIAKDVASAMVLVGAIGAVVIGLILFLPRFYTLLIIH